MESQYNPIFIVKFLFHLCYKKEIQKIIFQNIN